MSTRGCNPGVTNHHTHDFKDLLRGPGDTVVCLPVKKHHVAPFETRCDGSSLLLFHFPRQYTSTPSSEKPEIYLGRACAGTTGDSIRPYDMRSLPPNVVEVGTIFLFECGTNSANELRIVVLMVWSCCHHATRSCLSSRG